MHLSPIKEFEACLAGGRVNINLSNIISNTNLMYTVLLFIILGIFTGFLFRNQKITFINKVITVLIWLLLFLLGAEVGLNDQVVTNFHVLGFEAFLIALFATFGSVIGAWLLWRKVK